MVAADVVVGLIDPVCSIVVVIDIIVDDGVSMNIIVEDGAVVTVAVDVLVGFGENKPAVVREGSCSLVISATVVWSRRVCWAVVGLVSGSRLGSISIENHKSLLCLFSCCREVNT